MKKVTLIGLGAMGVFFAPRISEKLGAGFRIMASGARKDRLEQKGVTVNGINYRFPIVTPEDNDGPSDLVIIAVKGYDLVQALKDIKYQVGPETIILPVLNGIDSEKQTADVYGQEHVLYSYMRVSIAMKDGKAEFDPEKGLIHFGEEKNDPGHFSDKVLAAKELFDRCGIDYKIDPDMTKGLWFKFMCNVGENMTCAMFGIPFGAFQKSADANYFRRAAMWEVIRVANPAWGGHRPRMRSTGRNTPLAAFHIRTSPPPSRIWRPESTQKWICLQVQWSAWEKSWGWKRPSAKCSGTGFI